MNTITPYLWFDGNAEEGMNFYISIFKDTRIISQSPMTVEFELLGQKFIGLNGGPMFKFNEAVSFVVSCDTQEEVDYYWNALIAGGGSESQCAWLRDKFCLSWQVVPKILGELIGSNDRDKAARAINAMLTMKKIDIQLLKDAYEDK